jgi:hypothetical protein
MGATRKRTRSCSDSTHEPNCLRPGQRSELSPEIDTAMALRRRASGLLALVVLRCTLDRRYPALAPLHPNLGFGLQLEGRLIQTSDPNLDEGSPGSAVSMSRDPQRGQKPRPSKLEVSPLISNASTGQCAYTVKTLPDSFLQSAQWQRRTCTGSPQPLERTAPQRHPPVRTRASTHADATQHRGARVCGNVPRAMAVYLVRWRKRMLRGDV